MLKEEDVNGKNIIYGNTPLHYARDVKVAQLLIEAGADVNAKNNSGETPLVFVRGAKIAKILYGYLSILTKDEKVAQLLIEAGADVNAKNNSSETPLMLVRGTKTTKFLIGAGADVNAKNNIDSATALHYVLQNMDYEDEVDEDIKCIETLIKAGGM